MNGIQMGGWKGRTDSTKRPKNMGVKKTEGREKNI